MTTIFCVLRSGGEFRPEHVQRLQQHAGFFAPDTEFVCLSDVAIAGVETIPLESDWPGWWAKMELFRPDLGGDMLYLDLDSSIVGDVSDMLSIGKTAIMRDVYRPAGLQSSIMFLAERDRREVWQAWAMHASEWQGRYRKLGDQGFLERLWTGKVALWQDCLPGHVVSYKVDCAGPEGIPQGARVIAFHGRPRPWEIGF